jgi:hypothetical protein
LVVSRAIVESECVIPAIPVSDIAGAMADVSAAGVAARFWQPAMRSAALKARIVFIVTPSKWSAVREPGAKAVTVAGQRREAKLLSCRLLSSQRRINRNED